MYYNIHPWSVACPRGFYKEATHDVGEATHDVEECLPCPLNSNTATDASSSDKQCVCNTGFTGPPGGPCQGIYYIVIGIGVLSSS